MLRISSLDQIQDEIKRIRDQKKGYFTNLYLDLEKFNLWIQLDLLFYLTSDESIIFIRKNSSFFNVYYCTSSIEGLNKLIVSLNKQHCDKIFIFDIIGQHDSLSETINVFNNHGFSNYTLLNRMSRLNGSVNEYVENNSIRIATPTDLINIKTLLFQYFDEYAEQLPLDEELIAWIRKEHILLYVENEQIIGFVIYDIIGITSYLRYWFVHPLHRNKKVGSNLLRRFFYESRTTKRQLFWVIKSNENAIIRYQHYGFIKENLVDFVLINTNKYYEDKSY